MESVDDFQRVVMIPLAHEIIKRTSCGMTWSGIENLRQGPLLYISNHRDIVLDAYLLQVILLENGFETSQIIAGTNLYVNQFVSDIAITNKIIAIGRGGSKRGFGEEMMHISSLLRQSLTAANECSSSVWIAQRNGRTKDRIDRTDPSIVHMLNMTGPISDYCIVPVTITYEIEPNAIYKARHLWHIDHHDAHIEENYLEQILGSILQAKGRIHYAFHEPVNLANEGLAPKVYFQHVAHRIDEAITSGYKRWQKNDEVERQWSEMLSSAPDELKPYMRRFAPDFA